MSSPHVPGYRGHVAPVRLPADPLVAHRKAGFRAPGNQALPLVTLPHILQIRGRNSQFLETSTKKTSPASSMHSSSLSIHNSTSRPDPNTRLPHVPRHTTRWAAHLTGSRIEVQTITTRIGMGGSGNSSDQRLPFGTVRVYRNRKAVFTTVMVCLPTPPVCLPTANCQPEGRHGNTRNRAAPRKPPGEH